MAQGGHASRDRASPADATPEEGPWSPGVSSSLPGPLKARVTLYDPAYSFVTWEDARARSDAVGLPPKDLAVTRPERLALHSVLIRVTSQLYVPDGPNYADLGLNLRRMADEIYRVHVEPDMARVIKAYNAVRDAAERQIAQLLEDEVYPRPAPAPPASGLWRMLRRTPTKPSAPDPTDRALHLAQAWKDERNEDVPSACKRALARTLGAVLNCRGRLLIDRDLLAEVTLGLVMNRLGSAAVGQAVEGLFDKAVETLGYRRLPPQSDPVVLNAKGASASGKSTIRAAQRGIAERLGYDWRDFAIISPDYWRKALIDYDGLGADYKYAAMLSGHELEVIDRKLDILMAVKGAEGTVPHMLIDRFRFDSFQPDRTRAEDSTLLTRFGSKVYLFFLITPPEETVERAWRRGLETGRYKAVDDLLFHNIEAYAGMPDLFLRWAQAPDDKSVHYEFLDNSVPRGSRPKSVASGSNGRLVIRDLDVLCNVDRYREINVDATRRDDVLARALSPKDAMAFVRRAIDLLDAVDILLPGSDTIFARSNKGHLTLDLSALPEALDPEIFAPFEPAKGPLGRIDPAELGDCIGA